MVHSPAFRSDWLTKAAGAVRKNLEHARSEGLFSACLSEQSNPKSEWQRLVHIGRQEIEQTCSRRVFEIARFFQDDDGLSEMCKACSGEENLACAAGLLQLDTFLDSDSVSATPPGANQIAAIFGELHEADSLASQVEMARDETMQSLIGFLLTLGMGMLTASPAASVASAAPAALAAPAAPAAVAASNPSSEAATWLGGIDSKPHAAPSAGLAKDGIVDDSEDGAAPSAPTAMPAQGTSETNEGAMKRMLGARLKASDEATKDV